MYLYMYIYNITHDLYIHIFTKEFPAHCFFLLLLFSGLIRVNVPSHELPLRVWVQRGPTLGRMYIGHHWTSYPSSHDQSHLFVALHRHLVE